MHELMKRRLAVGLSQKSLAKRLGVSANTVCRWEIGQTVPRPVQYPVLASIFGCEPADVVSWWHPSDSEAS